MNTGIFLFIAMLIFFVLPFALFVKLILGEIFRVMPVSARDLLRISWLKENRSSSYW